MLVPSDKAEALANAKLKSMGYKPAFPSHNHGWNNVGPNIWIQYWQKANLKPVPVSLRTDDNTIAIWMISEWKAL